MFSSHVLICVNFMYAAVYIVNIFCSSGQHKGRVVHSKGELIGSSNFLSIMVVMKEIEIMHLPSRMQWS